MASKKTLFAGCVAHIYDSQDQLCTVTTVVSYDPQWEEIEIGACPDIEKGETYRILLLSSPFPYEYRGTVRQQLKNVTTIALYQRTEKKDRQSMRYQVAASAVIERIFSPGRPCEDFHPLVVRLINLSRGGIRIGTRADALTIGDGFSLRLKLEGGEKLLLAQVMNTSSDASGNAEYGCRFIQKRGMESPTPIRVANQEEPGDGLHKSGAGQ